MTARGPGLSLPARDIDFGAAGGVEAPSVFFPAPRCPLAASGRDLRRVEGRRRDGAAVAFAPALASPGLGSSAPFPFLDPLLVRGGLLVSVPLRAACLFVSAVWFVVPGFSLLPVGPARRPLALSLLSLDLSLSRLPLRGVGLGFLGCAQREYTIWEYAWPSSPRIRIVAARRAKSGYLFTDAFLHRCLQPAGPGPARRCVASATSVTLDGRVLQSEPFWAWTDSRAAGFRRADPW